MSTDQTLSALVADEIRALLGRRNLNKAWLARSLDVSHTWVTNRLAGHVEISLGDLARIAEAFDVPVAALLPGEGRRREIMAANQPSNERWHGTPDALVGAGPIGHASKAQNGRSRHTGDQVPRRPVRLTGLVTT